ncbi:MAG: FAD-binding protein, partial [Desulfamplus sp.]|nr:FAD-binding protein [Desulfamplus sp.]
FKKDIKIEPYIKSFCSPEHDKTDQNSSCNQSGKGPYSNKFDKNPYCDKYMVTAWSGALLSRLCKKTMEQGLGDLSFAAGIPGTVGGAVSMNAGTGMGTISDQLHSIEIIDLDGTIKTLGKDQLAFSHRHLAFPGSSIEDGYLSQSGITGKQAGITGSRSGITGSRSGITGSRSGITGKNIEGIEPVKESHQLVKKSHEPVKGGNGQNYPIILKARFLLEKGDRQKIMDSWQALMEKRKLSQPHGVPCAGCFFKNPGMGPSAGELIDRAGLKKRRVGDAMVSDIHANFIVNLGNASAADILALGDIITEKVQKEFGVILSSEVILKG